MQVGHNLHSATTDSRTACPTESPTLASNKLVSTQHSLQLHVLSASCTRVNIRYGTVQSSPTTRALPHTSTAASWHRACQQMRLLTALQQTAAAIGAHPRGCTSQHPMVGCSTTGMCSEPHRKPNVQRRQAMHDTVSKSSGSTKHDRSDIRRC